MIPYKIVGNLNFIRNKPVFLYDSLATVVIQSGFFDEESPVGPHAAAFIIVKQVAVRYSTVSGHLWFDYCPSLAPQNVVRRAAGSKRETGHGVN